MCEMAGSRLMAWMDDELGEAEALEVAAHVKGCVSCTAQVRRTRSITADVAEYAGALMSQSQGRRGRRWIPAAAAAAVLLAAALRLLDTAAPSTPVRVAAPAADHGEPSILVAVPIQDLLPIGAAPPGAVVVGKFVLDAGGTPKSFRLQEPEGD